MFQITLEWALLWFILLVSLSGLAYAVLLIKQILKKDEGTPAMIKIAKAIRGGANSYLRKQFRAVFPIVAVLTIALFFTAYLATTSYYTAGTPEAVFYGAGRAGAFVMGSVFSASVGYIGMNMATRGNVRVASAARRSFSEALQIGYRTGTITGMLTDGLGLLGGVIVFMIYQQYAFEVLLGYGFGGSLIALFMRIGGGIYTKAADVGADMVGKVERGIPEDDPRNPAVIADLVGDNVGDCAGMAADIFESYEVTIVSAMILGYLALGFAGVIFPLIVRAIGVIASIIGTYFVKARGEMKDALRSIKFGFNTSATISIVGFFLAALLYVGLSNPPGIPTGVDPITLSIRLAIATLTGVILAVSINELTDRFTSIKHGAVKGLARSTNTGAATTILRGLSIGYEGSVWNIIVIATAILVSAVIFVGLTPVFIFYGVALCGIGMLTLTGNNISMDTFGPVSDNAEGIGEMAGLKDGEVAEILAQLDSVGNTTKAITKGIAIASAVIAAVALFWSYVSDTGIGIIDVANVYVFIGLLIGGSIPLLFSSIAIRAVDHAASKIILEVRRQFHTIPGLMEGKAEPDYNTSVAICVSAAQRELVGLGVIAILTPLIVGFLLGVPALGGFLAGVILVGQLLAVFMATSGAAWDNSKKAIEAGLYGGKRSEAHKVSVIGDTIGDPLKDTAGPAINPMIKVINLVSLLIAPLIAYGLAEAGAALAVGDVGSVIVDAVIGFVLIVAVALVVWNSKKESKEMLQIIEEMQKQHQK
ncbi:MAG: sodium-translocating pyrophosphatase [Candidatus Odinarchaeum yellowstonii]|uniref:K(+)-insensitive pyrophosphate-energized proton pump n=1 Tax=Odinarchaeota yellowstonii (strain LCB_4) TaxID=1841599 RepID=A0AAF0D2L2_ODILC|nr:MAG: sodium-translocating pyrophosphatase [Candidatus Odinarchaeum yellowstonii]